VVGAGAATSGAVDAGACFGKNFMPAKAAAPTTAAIRIALGAGLRAIWISSNEMM